MYSYFQNVISLIISYTIPLKYLIMTNTPDILKKIIARKEQEVIERKKNISFDQLMKKAYDDRETIDFYQALKNKVDLKQNAIIAEIKKASPQKAFYVKISIQ